MYEKVFDMIKFDIQKRNSALTDDLKDALKFVSIKDYKKIMFLLEVNVDVLVDNKPAVMRYTYDLLNDTHLRLESLEVLQ